MAKNLSPTPSSDIHQAPEVGMNKSSAGAMPDPRADRTTGTPPMPTDKGQQGLKSGAVNARQARKKSGLLNDSDDSLDVIQDSPPPNAVLGADRVETEVGTEFIDASSSLESAKLEASGAELSAYGSQQASAFGEPLVLAQAMVDAPTAATLSSASASSSAAAATSASSIGAGGFMVLAGVIVAASRAMATHHAPTTQPIETPSSTPLSLVVQDGYLDGAEVWVDMNDNGVIDALIDYKFGISVNGKVDGSLTEAQKLHALITTGGTDISTGLAFQGSYSATAGSTVVNPLTSLVQSMVQSSMGSTAGMTDAQKLARISEVKASALAAVNSALGLPLNADLTRIDTISTATALTGDAASGISLEQALVINSKALMLANLMTMGAAALQGASTSSGGVPSMSTFSNFIVQGIVDAINTAAASGETVALGDSDSLTAILTSASTAAATAATAAGGSFAMDSTKLSAATAAMATSVASTNSLITTLTGNAITANAITSGSATGALTQMLAAQKTVLSQLDELQTNDVRVLNTFKDVPTVFIASQSAENTTGLKLGTQAVTAPTVVADTVAATVSRVTVEPERVGDLAQFVVEMSEGLFVKFSGDAKPTIAIQNTANSTAIAVFDPGASTGNKLVFTYRVQAGDTQLGIATGTMITLLGTSAIKDLGGNSADRRLDSGLAEFKSAEVIGQVPVDKSVLTISSPDLATAIDENTAANTQVYTATSAQQGVTFTLNQAAAALGDSRTITQTSAIRVTDTLAAGVTLTRGTTGPMFSSTLEDGSPSIEWNSDGWAHLGNVAGRTYTSFANALNNKVGDYILPAELVIHDRVNDTYYKVDFTQYQGGGNGGAFSYQRSQITLSAENNFDINDQGEVVLTVSPDYETRSAYEFTVLATDGEGNTVQKTVTLPINNLDETAPVITSGNTARTLVVDTGANQVVYTVKADDSGDSSTGAVTYSLAAPPQAVLGDAVEVNLPRKSFYRGMDYTDVIAPGVGFSRGIKNPGFAVTLEWNTDGWDNLGQVAQRAYDIEIPNNFDALVMHDIFADRYYKLDFNAQDGGYIRTEILANGTLGNPVTISAETLTTNGDAISEVLKLQLETYANTYTYQSSGSTDALTFVWGEGNVLDSNVSDRVMVHFQGRLTIDDPDGTGLAQALAFQLDSDDRLYIQFAKSNGQYLGSPLDGSNYTNTATLTAGQTYWVDIWYQENTGAANLFVGLPANAKWAGALHYDTFAVNVGSSGQWVAPWSSSNLKSIADEAIPGDTFTLVGSDPNSMHVRPTVEWNADGWADLSDLKDVKTRVFDAEVNGNTATTTDWVMHDTVSNTYYTVNFSKWSMGGYDLEVIGGNGGFAYTRQQIDLSGTTPALGEAVAVYVRDGMDAPVDAFDSGAELTRFYAQPLQGVQTVEWNADGWGDDLTDVATRNYTTNMALAVMLDPDNYDSLGDVMLDREWLMHDLVNDTYYKIQFDDWYNYYDGAGFAYTRSQIDVQTGELLNTVEFTKSAETPFDRVDDGVVISRGMKRPLNSSGVEWNGDGWSDLEDVDSRDFYTNLADAKSNGTWTDNEFVMHDLLSDRYYKIDLTSWPSYSGGMDEKYSGGAVSYVRSEIIKQYETDSTIGDFAIDPVTGDVRLLADPLPANSPYPFIVVATDAAGNVSRQEVALVVQPDYAPVFDTTGLVAYWKMDEGTGTVAQDSGPNGLDANLMSGASWANNGAPGLATDSSVSLNNDYLQVADSQLFNLSSGFTISAWVKPSDVYDNVIIDRGQYNFLLSIGPNGNPGLGFSNKYDWFYSKTAIKVNEWVHVAVSWDPDIRAIKLYKDGALTDTFTNIQPLDFSVKGDLNIGRQNPSYPYEHEMNGQLDEVAIFDRALGASEISSLMQEGLQSGAVAFADHGEGVAYQAVATDANAGTVPTYGLLNSADAALFTIDTTTGAVRFNVAPDMSDPLDAGGNNIYNITITASDGVNKPTELAVSIEVLVPPSIAEKASSDFTENETGVVFTAEAVASYLTYSLAGADAALFAIDAGTGELRFVNAPDFEKPLDAGKNNVYDVSVVANTYNLQASQQVSVSILSVYEAPVIASASSAQTAENNTGTVYTAHTTAEAGSTLTYALGGADATLFSINKDSGAVAFLAAPNYEDPLDDDGNNQYELTVTADDGTTASKPQSVVIAVTNVIEPSAVNVTVSADTVAEGNAANLVYTFTRSGDIDRALTVNIGMGGTATAEDYASNGPLAKSWSRLGGGSGGDYLYSIAATADGGLYTVGTARYYNSSNPLKSADSVALTPLGEADVFIRKYGSDGSQQWTRLYGAAKDDAATSVVVGSDGSAYVAGYGNGSNGSNSTFIVKYSAVGVLDNTWELTGLFPSNWVSRSLALAPDEATLFVGGWFDRNGRESYITKVTLSPEGTPGTPETFTLPNRAAAAIAAASDGSVYLTGFTDYSIDDQKNAGRADAFVSKLDSAGQEVWSRLIGDGQDNFGTSVLVGPDGSVYVAGGSYSSIFVSKFNSDGLKLWEQSIANGRGADSSNYPCSLAMGSDGWIYLSGIATQAIGNQVALGQNDAFLSQINPDNGDVAWSRIVGGAGDDRARAIAAGPDGEIYIGGSTYDSYDNLKELGGGDGFVTKFSPPSLPTVTFAPGSTTATLALKATADELTEGNETVTVTVLAGRGYDVGSTFVATGTIEDVIDLGKYGNLIAPVEVGSDMYYYWDRSGDGTANAADFVPNHDFLDSLFIYASDFVTANPSVDTTDVYRFASIEGLTLALPSLQEFQAIEAGTNGLPLGWFEEYYWTATPGQQSFQHASYSPARNEIQPEDPDTLSMAVAIRVITQTNYDMNVTSQVL